MSSTCDLLIKPPSHNASLFVSKGLEPSRFNPELPPVHNLFVPIVDAATTLLCVPTYIGNPLSSTPTKRATLPLSSVMVNLHPF